MLFSPARASFRNAYLLGGSPERNGSRSMATTDVSHHLCNYTIPESVPCLCCACVFFSDSSLRNNLPHLLPSFFFSFLICIRKTFSGRQIASRGNRMSWAARSKGKAKQCKCKCRCTGKKKVRG
ncbi:hypothetical protein ABW19_dt0204765 [Dactylella cylindrospora]|nr:hypothetical protein ABW19_dt0204765 [Dactylella cylindrospora]